MNFTTNKIICTFLIATIWLFVIPAQATIYKWTDSEGKVYFGDRPPANKNVETINIDIAPPLTVKNPTVTNKTSNASSGNSSKPVNKHRINKRIVMYGTAWCSYCKKAREYFKKAGIRFVEYDVEKRPSRMREFKRLGGTGYPLILIGKNQRMQGFSISGFVRRYKR